MVNFFKRIFSRAQPEAVVPYPSSAPSVFSTFDGEKFLGGFGATVLYETDYWTLRERSEQLFKDNIYASGIIKRLITNEINTGLTPEATPDEAIIGLPADSLNDWTEDVENRFGIWAKSPKICDWEQSRTFGDIQRLIRIESLITGDVLVVLRPHPTLKVPQIQVIKGSHVVSPMGGSEVVRKGHTVTHGVERDANKRHVAYWVKQDDGSVKRMPAWGEKSGRRLAWMVYGSMRRVDAVRGEPLLSILLQSLREIDRYRDSAQRKAVINSILAMFIKKTQDKPGTLPISGGAQRKTSETTVDSDGVTRKFNIADHLPGLVIEELQTGEEPVLKGGEGTDINFPAFESAIIRACAWSLEVPPEIVELSFTNNYSASQAAINEFKIYLNYMWSHLGETVCTPIYTEWLLAEILRQRIVANGLLQAWRDPEQYDIYGAWVSVEWYGSIKPSTDMLKQAKGSKMLVENGWSTNAREARITTGTKYSKNIKRLKRENEMYVEAMRPLMEFKSEYQGVSEPAADPLASAEANELIAELDDYLNDVAR